MKTIFSLDFKKVDYADARISLMDRGFLYGDSIYEAVRTYNRKLFLFDKHFDRLMRSAQMMALPIKFTRETLRKHVLEIIGGLDFDAYIRIIVTRGEDEAFDLNPRKDANPRVAVVVRPIHSYPQEFYTRGISLGIVSVKRNLKDALNPEIKSGNYLNNVLAIMEAKNKGFNDALMTNEKGFVTESTTSNFFIIKDGVVLTPKLESGILHGITREFLIAAMEKEKVAFKVDDISREDVYLSDECFVTATTKEIMPVRMIDSKVIGSGEVGKHTLKLMSLYKQEVKSIINS